MKCFLQNEAMNLKLGNTLAMEQQSYKSDVYAVSRRIGMKWMKWGPA